MSVNVPFFSIIVPTRNRPGTLQRTLNSIAEQSFSNFEVIVVDDGSNLEGSNAIQILLRDHDTRFKLIHRSADEPQHGPNVSRNAGIEIACGTYIGFLDDDDYWTDTNHLAIAEEALGSHGNADVFVANQIAKRDQDIVVSNWLPYLDRIISKRDKIHEQPVYRLKRADLLQPEGIGFVHVNICLIRNELVRSVIGFWNQAPYEGDLDFFLRWMDKVETILYRSATVSILTLRNSEIDPGVSSVRNEAKQLFRILACQHAELHCTRPDVIAYARLLHGGVLKELAKQNYKKGRFFFATDFAIRGVAVDPSFKWRCIVVFVKLRALFSRTGSEPGKP